MNDHVSEEIRKKWCNYEFQGKSMKMPDGKTYIRAYSKVFGKTHFYCFEDDWFWHERPLLDPPKLTKPKSLIEYEK